MKKMMKKLAGNMKRMKMAIVHLFDAYDKTLNELRNTNAYAWTICDDGTLFCPIM